MPHPGEWHLSRQAPTVARRAAGAIPPRPDPAGGAREELALDNPGTALDRSGRPNPVPRIAGDITRPEPIQARDTAFLRAAADRTVKITVPGPFTMSQQAQNDHYPDARSVALAYAEVVRAEIADLFAAGADIVQVDEPYLQARPEAAREYGVEVLNRALEGAPGPTALHICFGYAAIIHERPEGYSFLAELADTPVGHISVETAQSNLDPHHPGAAARQGRHPRRPRAVHPGGRDPRRRRRPHSPRAAARRRLEARRSRVGGSRLAAGPEERGATLGGLGHDSDVGPRRRPAVGPHGARLVVGHRPGDDHVVALPPVDRR